MSPLDPVDATPLEGRVRTLEGAFNFARGAALVVGALLTTGVGAVGAGAMATRDATLAQGARLTALEARSTVDDAARERREEADRQARDSLIEIRSDLRALRQEVEALSQRFQRAEDGRPGARR